MRTRRNATIEDLRRAIDCLPRHTKVAMLEGIRANPIIVGAYSDDGGICPMLAAHRAGGRTNVISFARAWDRYAFRGSRRHRARRATERELLVLRSHLQASLLDEDGPSPELAAAIAEHRMLLATREPEPDRDDTRGRDSDRDSGRSRSRGRDRPGDADRSRELAARPGWAWMRVFRRYDEYEHALARLESDSRAAEREPVH